MRGTRDDGRSRRADLPSPETPRGVVRISFVAPALPAATRRSRRPSNGTIPCPAPTRDASRVGVLAGPGAGLWTLERREQHDRNADGDGCVGGVEGRPVQVA